MKQLLVVAALFLTGCAAKIAEVTPTMTPEQITDAINKAIETAKPIPTNYGHLVALIVVVVVATLVIKNNSVKVISSLYGLWKKLVAWIKTKI